MRVERLTTLEQLAPLADDWDRMAEGIPLRSWTWMETWWRHFGLDQVDRQECHLYVLVVRDETDSVVGIAPWYIEQVASRGRVIRFLATGEVCSDHLSLLCGPGREEDVTDALADWLASSVRSSHDRWDLLEMTGVDAATTSVRRLVEKLAERGSPTDQRPGPNCWQIELPDTWEEFLAALSKTRRKRLRQTDRQLFQTGRAKYRVVERLADLDRGQKTLIDLHQRRWRSLGELGCFASMRFLTFHQEIMPRMLKLGQLHLAWLELDDRPIAAEYHLLGNGVSYAYQSGIDPEVLDHSPGNLANGAALRWAIEHGHRVFDFLRGDEPYKASWTATPGPSVEFRVAAARPTAQLRHGIWLAASNIKQWAKGVMSSE